MLQDEASDWIANIHISQSDYITASSKYCKLYYSVSEYTEGLRVAILTSYYLFYKFVAESRFHK